jgi:hypothetical protein
MKTIAILFLSLVMAKSCQDKKEAVEAKPTEATTAAETKPIAATEETITEKPQSVDNGQKQENSRIAEYEASSRGFFTKIKFSNNELTVSKDRNNAEKGTPIKITKEEVSELNALLQSISPESLPDLKWPTEKRFYDGAAHASLIITSNGKTYTSAGFDHGHPPAAIEKFVERLLKLTEKE